MYSLKYIADNGNVIKFGLQHGIVVSEINDLSQTEITLAMSQGIGQTGSTIQGQAVQYRDIPVTGEIIGDATAHRRLLHNTIMPMMGGRFVFNDEWELHVMPLLTPAIQNNARNARFSFVVRAAFPYWQAATASAFDLSGMVARFRFPVNYGTPHIFGERIAGFFRNIINNGNVPVLFSVRFKAVSALDNPKIIKVATGEFVRVVKHMEAGESITINVNQDGITVTNIYRGIETDIFGLLDMDSEPFTLDVGDNILRYAADSNEEGLNSRVTIRPARTGAYQ